MKKEFLKIGIAGILLLAIAIPLSLYRQKEMQKIDAEDKGKKFITVDLSKIQRVEIINKKGDVVLERRKKDASGKFQDEFEARSFEYKDPPEWIVIKPYRGLSDQNLVEGFFTQIRDMGYLKVVQDNQDRKKDYSLDPALLSLRFFNADSMEPDLVLDMGSENPAATAFYFSASNKPGIYLGERILQPFQQQDTDRWFEKRVLGIPNSTQLEQIKVQHADKINEAFEVIKEKDDWIFSPLADNLAADGPAIGSYAAEIDNIHAIDILSEEASAKKGKSLGSVTLKFKALKDPVTYYVFADPKDKQLGYIQRSDMKSVFSIGLNSKLLPNFPDFVSKKLMDQGFNLFKGFNIVRGNTTIEMVNENQKWKVKKPYQDDANPRRLDSIVKSILELKTKAYFPKKVLNQKERKLRFEYTLPDESLNAVSFYQEGTQFFVQAEGKTKARVFSISQIPPDIYEHLEHLRNDDLVPVSSEHVKRIVFMKGNARVEIEQNEKKQRWFLKFLEGVSATVNMKWKEELTPEELFNRASEMYIVNFMDKVDPAAKFDTATLDIYSDQNQQYTWKFGEKKGELIHVFSPDRNVSGTMPWVKYEELATFLDEPAKSGKK